MKIGAGIVLVLVALLVMARDGRAAEPPQPWPMLALAEVPAVFDSPVHITHAGDGSGRLFIVHKVGLVEILQGNQVLSPPFLDIRDRVGSDDFETGLFSIAFAPDFKASGVFYVDYTTKESVIEPDGTEPLEPDGNHDTIVARFRVTADPNIADPAGEERILIQNQPYRNHNGGQLLFGPDGYLYIGFGDGGGLSDPLYTSQRTNTLLGKLLRVQVGASGPYTVPTTNPFYGKEGYRPEIWAMGLRNPWRFSFDRLTGDLYIGDVGKSSYEEINFQPASSPGGENYGWSITEGMHCYPSWSMPTARAATAR
jgi:glucose/arabinose dehydrogenase